MFSSLKYSDLGNKSLKRFSNSQSTTLKIIQYKNKLNGNFNHY